MRSCRRRFRSSCSAEKLGCPFASAEITSPSRISLPAGRRATSAAIVGNRAVQSRPECVERHPPIAQVRLHAVAVELELVHVAGAGGHLLPQGGEARLDEVREWRRLGAWQNAGEEPGR